MYDAASDAETSARGPESVGQIPGMEAGGGPCQAIGRAVPLRARDPVRGV